MVIAAQHPEWKGQVVLLAVSVDERIEDAAKCFAEHQWKNVSTVWAGPDVLKAYHGSSLPTVYVIDRNGNVAAANPRLDIPEILSPLLQPTKS